MQLARAQWPSRSTGSIGRVIMQLHNKSLPLCATAFVSSYFSFLAMARTKSDDQDELAKAQLQNKWPTRNIKIKQVS